MNGNTVDTLAYIPRDISLAYRAADGSKFYFSPLRDIVGGVLATSPSVIKNRLTDTQIYKKWYKRQRPPIRTYEPLFTLDDEILSEPDISGALRTAVKEKEGTYRLFDKTSGEVMPDGIFVRGKGISATVKSKSRQKGRTSTFYTTNRIGADLGLSGDIQLESMYCKCEDFAHGTEKSHGDFNMACLHQGALGREYFMRKNYPGHRGKLKGKLTKNKAFVPFTFVQNYVPGQPGGFKPLEPGLASLEYEALIAYYLMEGSEDKHFGIDRRLLSIPDVYTFAMLEGVRNGTVRREVVGQRPAKLEKSEQEIGSEKLVFLDLVRQISNYDYRPVGRSLEFGKDVAIRYENGSNAVSVVFGEGPMYCVTKEGINADVPVNPAGEFVATDNPVEFIGSPSFQYDDRAMRRTLTNVHFPSALRIPETGERHLHIRVPELLKEGMKNAIKETFSEGPLRDGKLKYARLYYD